MSAQHPITPPPELVGSIIDEGQTCNEMIRLAYAAGADQELEACCEWLSFYSAASDARDLCGARRPKPLSMKDEALAVLDDCSKRLNAAHENVIRRALEALPDE